MSEWEITEEKYQEMREESLKNLEKFAHITINKLTCDDCPFHLDCEFSADGYNIDGDCLAEK